MKRIVKLIFGTLTVLFALEASAQETKKFLRAKGEWVLTYAEDIGSIRIFDGEILPEIGDTGEGKKINYYGFDLDVIFTEQEKSKLSNALNYEKFYIKTGKKADSLTKAVEELHSLLEKAFTIRTINGAKVVSIDLTNFDKQYSQQPIYVANKNQQKVELVGRRSFAVDLNDLDPTIRVIPKGSQTLFLSLDKINKTDPENDATRFEVLNTQSGDTILRDLQKSAKYYQSGLNYKIGKPLPLDEYSLTNGKVLIHQNGAWTQQTPSTLPAPLWLLILIGAVLVVVLFIPIYLLRIKRIQWVRHKVGKGDTLDSLKDRYSVEGVEVRRSRIIELNSSILEGFNKEDHYDTLIHKRNRDAIGKTLIIPIWKSTYEKHRREPVNEDQVHERVNKSFGDNISTSYSQDLPEGSEILKRVRNIESKLISIYEDNRQDDLRVSQSQNARLKANNEEFERKLGELKSEKDQLLTEISQFRNRLDGKTDELKERDAALKSLEQDLESLQESEAKTKSKLKAFRQRVLLFSEASKKFADSRVQLLESGINIWEELSLIFQESQRINQFELESQSLGQILHRKVLVDTLMMASSCLKQLAYLGQTGVWTDANHVRKLRQEKDESAGLKFIDKSLTQEVIAPFLSRLMVCLEESRSLETTLAKKSDLMNRIAEVGSRLHDIRKQAEEFGGIAIDYVPLFSSVSGHSQVRAIERQPGGLYANIPLDKNHILEIEEYGYRAAGHSTLTTVIIKR